MIHVHVHVHGSISKMHAHIPIIHGYDIQVYSNLSMYLKILSLQQPVNMICHISLLSQENINRRYNVESVLSQHTFCTHHVNRQAELVQSTSS